MAHDPGPAFRALHRPGDPFILANAWDIGSARMLAALGAQAIGTSSAAHAFTLGQPDGLGVSRDAALAHAADLVAATALPVSADLENGFGPAPEDCAETVRLAEEAGVAGLSIEDTDFPSGASYDRSLAVERIRASVSAARALGRDVVLLARADGVMTGAYSLDEALARIRAYAEAGADGVYIPMPPDEESLATICKATTKPVNALAAGKFTRLSRTRFADLGVARISLGSALARAVHRVIHDAAGEMFENGNFAPLSNGLGGDIVDRLLRDGAR